MNSATRGKGNPASGCLDDETLCAFLEGRLDPSVVTRIDGHAATCADCRELIAASAKVAGESAVRPPRVGASVLLDAGPKKRSRVGATLKDKWLLDERIGSGGMADVYSATHRNGKRVAIKILLPQLAVDPELCRRFVQEGYIANQVGHPGVVAVHDDDMTDDGAPFIVMDLLEGECISDIVALGRMGGPESVRVVRELLEILAAAHAKGVLHRDIKPGNIFRTSNGEVRLLDFGIARLTSANTSTITGATMGTPAYMPPEQAKGVMREVDARSDVWAVGATLFSMLTGAKVRDAESNNALLVLAATEPIPPTRQRAAWVSPALADVIDKALAFEKADRYSSATEMGIALANLPLEALEDGSTDATIHQHTVVPATVAGPPPFTVMSSATSVAPTAAPAAKQRFVFAAGVCAFIVAATGAMVAIGWGGRKNSTAMPEVASMALASAAPSTTPSIEAKPTESAPPAETPPSIPAPTLATARSNATNTPRPASSASKSKTNADSPASSPAKAVSFDPYQRRH